MAEINYTGNVIRKTERQGIPQIMKKTIGILTAVLFACAAAIGVMTWCYASSDAISEEAFENSTFINGVNCSGLPYEDAEGKLADDRNGGSIVMKDDSDKTLAVYRNFDFTFDISDKTASFKKDHIILAALNHYLGIPLKSSITMTIDEDNGDLKEQIEETPFIESLSSDESKDAYVDLTDPSFPIVAEVYGSKPDVDQLYHDICAAIEKGDRTFIYSDDSYHDIPDITSESEEILNYQKFCLKYLNQKIEYKLGSETFTIAPEELATLYKDDLSGDADEDAVSSYVSSLADKYDNAGMGVTFESVTSGTVSLSSGTYGWTIDREKEAEQLASDINSHKDVSREPVWAQKGYSEYSDTIGNTYVDADLSAQKVTVIKDGKKIFQCDCVSGNEAMGYNTPTGAFYIVNRLQNLVLRGDNADGTKYESPVKYWCGFYKASHGFHDADWRSTFGGTIYKTNGSHGCINMPPSLMPEFFEKVEVGMPVMVHK